MICAEGYALTFTASERSFRALSPMPRIAAGASSETPLEHYQPPPRAHISWEFDNRNCLRCAAAPAAPSREKNNSPSNNSHSNTKACVGRASTPTSGSHDTDQTQGQNKPHRTPEGAVAATVAKCDLGNAPSSSADSARGRGPGAGTTKTEPTRRSFGVDGRNGGSDDDDAGLPHATSWGGAATDVGIGRHSAAEPPKNAPAVTAAAAAATVRSPTLAKAPTMPPGSQGGGSEDGGNERKEQAPAAWAASSDGDIAATGLEALRGSEPGRDPETGGPATGTDAGVLDRTDDTPPRSGRGRRRELEGKDASARDGNNSEASRNGSPVRSVRGRQDSNTRASSPVGEAQRNPGRTVQGEPQVHDGCGGEQGDSEAAGGNRANPAASVWIDSSSGSSAGRDTTSPTQRSRGSPKTEREEKSIFETPATTKSGGYDGRGKTTPTTTSSKKGADSRESHGDNGTAGEGQGRGFARPNASDQDARTRSRGRGIGEEGRGGDDGSSGSVDCPTNAAEVKPTKSVATQPGAAQSGNASDVESRCSRQYRETGGGGGGGEKERTVGDSRAVGEEPAKAAEEDEYGSDFASQVPQRCAGVAGNAPTRFLQYISQ